MYNKHNKKSLRTPYHKPVRRHQDKSEKKRLEIDPLDDSCLECYDTGELEDGTPCSCN